LNHSTNVEAHAFRGLPQTKATPKAAKGHFAKKKCEIWEANAPTPAVPK